MRIDEEELTRLSGYTSRASLRKWVMKAGWRLLPPGKNGKVAAECVEKNRTSKGPDFAAITAQRRKEAG